MIQVGNFHTFKSMLQVNKFMRDIMMELNLLMHKYILMDIYLKVLKY